MYLEFTGAVVSIDCEIEIDRRRIDRVRARDSARGERKIRTWSLFVYRSLKNEVILND